ncbi:MAG: type II toxin-antitoxin system VapC family toxin [Chitinophagaceae bacterium]|nr:MAG: type II toxin-antitoxin system VapC family toxin [Chitinophagaceae bacterium]
MAGKYLIDTNAVIDYLSNKLPGNASNMLDEEALEISVIIRMELPAWGNAESQQLSILEDFINSVVVWSLDEPVIIKGIEIRKNFRIKLPDAIIAATPVVHELTLVTRNVNDFKNITGLRLINPWDM